jgi:hypothetical protein
MQGRVTFKLLTKPVKGLGFILQGDGGIGFHSDSVNCLKPERLVSPRTSDALVLALLNVCGLKISSITRVTQPIAFITLSLQL